MVEKRALKMRGERIGLAVLEKEDLPYFKRWWNDPRLSLFMREFDQMLADENVLEWYDESIHDDTQIDFAIVSMETGKLLGACSLVGIDKRNEIGEARIFIGNPKFWNQGYGREAMVLLLDYAFNVINLNNVRLSVNEINDRAVKAYKKIGFKEAGRIRKARVVGRAEYDLVIMDMLGEEFDKLHESWIRRILEESARKP